MLLAGSFSGAGAASVSEYVPSAGERVSQSGSMTAAVGSSATGFNCEVSPMNGRSSQRVFNRVAGVYQDGTTSLGAQDILLLGDSQVWDQSWVARGVRQAGYNPVLYRCGGIGITNSRPGFSGSYYNGVVGNEWDLPVGKPRAVYIQGSGNDSGSEQSRQDAIAKLGPTVAKLRQLYPGVQIIVTGPVGSDVSWQGHRWDMNAKLSAFAARNGLTFISYEKWVTDYGVRWGLADDVHFRDENQGLLAAPMTESLRAALAGFTLLGGVEGYVTNGGGSARFGVPLSNETVSVDGGVWQRFSKNYSVYWSPFSGTRSVWFSGAIGQKFASLGYERGVGYPVEDESSYAYGARQSFVRASGRQARIYWSPQTGAHAMVGGGAIFGKWVGAGHATTVGFPTTDEQVLPCGGVVQYFKNARGGSTAIFWSPTSGAHSMVSGGAIYYKYLNSGYTSVYGYPVTDEYRDAAGVVHVKFSKGYDIQWTESGGVKVVRG